MSLTSGTSRKHADSARFEQLLQEEELMAAMEADHAADGDAMLWTTERVRKWLVQVGLEDLYGVKINYLHILIRTNGFFFILGV